MTLALIPETGVIKKPDSQFFLRMKPWRKWNSLTTLWYPQAMQITVNIPDDFAAQVQARGLTPESYVEGLIAEQTAALQSSGPSRELTSEEFNASLDALTRYSDKIPSHPIPFFSRDSNRLVSG
jgi:hypothetical protein